MKERQSPASSKHSITMFPIHKLKITKEKLKDGSLAVIAGMCHTEMAVMSPAQQRIEGLEKYTEDSLRQRLWRSTYEDIHLPLIELMFLARCAANANPAAYPEAARIEELTKELNDLLDWKKQMAAEQEKDQTK